MSEYLNKILDELGSKAGVSSFEVKRAWDDIVDIYQKDLGKSFIDFTIKEKDLVMRGVKSELGIKPSCDDFMDCKGSAEAFLDTI